MTKDIFLAWAVPVDPEEVTASLIAYESTYTVINTFRLCARYNAFLSRLPPELLSSIEDYVLSSSRANEIAKRDMPFRCLTDDCMPDDHLTVDKRDELKQLALGAFESQNLNVLDEDDQSAFEEAFEDFFVEFLYENDGDWGEKHRDQLEEMYRELIEGHSTTLSKAQALFAKNVGLRVHYDVLPRYYEHEWDTSGNEKLECASIRAFLILPRHESKLDGVFGPNNTAVFSLLTRIDPLVFTPLRDSERSLFNNALRMLQLKVSDNWLRKNMFSSWEAATVDMTASGITNSSDKQALRSSSIEGHGEWPALMLLGSGELGTYDGVW